MLRYTVQQLICIRDRFNARDVNIAHPKFLAVGNLSGNFFLGGKVLCKIAKLRAENHQFLNLRAKLKF